MTVPEQGGPVVDISLDDPAWRVALPGVEDVCREVVTVALRAAAPDLAATEISLVLTDDAAVALLNENYRLKQGPTNVLSFPACDWRAGERPAAPGDAPMLLGDIVVAFGVARDEAERDRKALADHLRHLVVHGLLHLLGHDHETDEEAQRMESLEAEILHEFGVQNPYSEEKPFVA